MSEGAEGVKVNERRTLWHCGGDAVTGDSTEGMNGGTSICSFVRSLLRLFVVR